MSCVRRSLYRYIVYHQKTTEWTETILVCLVLLAVCCVYVWGKEESAGEVCVCVCLCGGYSGGNRIQTVTVCACVFGAGSQECVPRCCWCTTNS
jgi:hypothetical protein